MLDNDFNGAGLPLEDKRLTLSGTTNAGEQQYRIWRDSQQILVPRGQSITKPLAPENVQANVGVFNGISKGYFRRPITEFRNTVDYKLFDRFFLAIYREGNQLPLDDGNIDLHYNIGLNRLFIGYQTIFSCDTVFTGIDKGIIELDWIDGNRWKSDKFHFAKFGLQEVYGDFYFVTNPTAEDTENGFVIDTTLFVQEVNLPLFVVVNRATIKNGNSEMEVIIKNPSFVFKLDSAVIEVLGGE